MCMQPGQRRPSSNGLKHQQIKTCTRIRNRHEDPEQEHHNHKIQPLNFDLNLDLKNENHS